MKSICIVDWRPPIGKFLKASITWMTEFIQITITKSEFLRETVYGN